MKDVNEVATLENAKAWNATSEKTMFCVDLLDIFSLNDRGAETAIIRLERKFENLLTEETS